ncbi:MAG: serine hydrolase [Gammaproteobacteria bacterium]|nr:serine hydrolase [Gammaproteobacteria bacterium]
MHFLWKFLKWAAIAVGGLVVLVVAFVGAFYLHDPLYAQRLLALRKPATVTDVDRYSPLEAVPGTERNDLEPVAAGSATISPEALAEATSYADETKSVALLVWRDGALELEKYWPGYGPDTRTDTASMHKTVLGLLTGAAIADGHIPSVDEPAARWLTEWQDEAHKRIKVRDLLQMSSGLELLPFSMNPLSRSSRSYLGTDLTGLALSLAAAEPPGQVFEYANMNSQLLGTIVQRASGKRYAQYLSERLWSRLGAGTAYLWLDRPDGMPHTFCCLQTTARGWLRIGLLLLNEGRVGDDQVVPAEWVRAMTTPAATNPNFGYQVWLGSPEGGVRRYSSKSVAVAHHSEPYVAPDVVFIDGFGGQRVYVVPSQRLVIVRTGQSAMNWDDARLPNAILKGLKPLPGQGETP